MRNQNDWFEYAEDTYCTPDFTDKAISILTNETDSGPKFVFLAYNAPHLPIQAPPEDIEDMRQGSWYYDAYSMTHTVWVIKMWTHFKSAICKTRNQKSLCPTSYLSCYDQVKWSHNLLPVKSSQLPVDKRGSLVKAVDDGMKKLVNKMKNKDRETIFIFSSDNGAVQIFDNPNKVRLSGRFLVAKITLTDTSGESIKGRLSSWWVQCWRSTRSSIGKNWLQLP